MLSYLALAVELGLSVCAVEEVDLIARQLRFRAWRSDFEVLGFLLGGCQRKECLSSIKAFGYLGMLDV